MSDNPQPIAGNGAALILEYLAVEGVEKLFSVPGAAIMHMLQELEIPKNKARFDLVVCRHETGAAYIAHGYSLVRDSIGVVLTTTGPGAANALTGAATAQSAGVAMLIVTGEVAQSFYGKGYLQEGAALRPDINQMFVNAVQYSAIASSAENLSQLLEQALRSCRSSPRRAAHLSVPIDVAKATGAAPSPRDTKYRAASASTDRDAVVAIWGELLARNRPLIYVGNGSRYALRDPVRAKNFKKMVEKFALPIATTPNAKGIFPEDHSCSLRNYGMAACAWPATYMAHPKHGRFDALLVLGSSLGELATTVDTSDYYSDRLRPDGPLMQVDLDATMIGRNFRVDRGVVGDVGVTIDVLCAVAAALPTDAESRIEARRALIAEITAGCAFAEPDDRASDAAPLKPAAVMRVLSEEVTSGHFFIDCGNCIGWALNNMVIGKGVEFHSALAMAPMGFAVGAVIGGKMADPAKPCVAVVGDGAFLMHGTEISTAAAHEVAAVWIVLYDNDLHMVSEGMDAFFGKQTLHRYPLGLRGPGDLVKIAEGLGARAVALSAGDGTATFRDRLRAALMPADAARRPQVIVVPIDPDPVPPYGWPKTPWSEQTQNWPQSIG